MSMSLDIEIQGGSPFIAAQAAVAAAVAAVVAAANADGCARPAHRHGMPSVSRHSPHTTIAIRVSRCEMPCAAVVDTKPDPTHEP